MEDIEEAKHLVQDNIDGLDELATLAQGLKDFSRLDRAEHAPFNVNEGLDKTLLIVNNRIKKPGHGAQILWRRPDDSTAALRRLTRSF